jgi:uncharacterized damage-inducible protein DinB
MLTETLQKLYQRDLSKLKEEIGLYANEADLWKTEGEISNSAGNLTLHLIGNVRHFFGAVLGETGYVRDRDKEFSDGGVLRADLLAGIDQAAEDVKVTLGKLTEEDLASTYPIEVFGEPITTEFFLTHLTTHLNYHLGQINYHRRLLGS